MHVVVMNGIGDSRSDLEIRGDRAECRLAGETPPWDVVRQVSRAITAAQRQNIGNLLVVASDFGPDRPTLSERFYGITQWARDAGGRVRVALVLRPEQIDPEQFDVLVAVNRGLVLAVFACVAEARAWLGASATAAERPPAAGMAIAA